MVICEFRKRNKSDHLEWRSIFTEDLRFHFFIALKNDIFMINIWEFCGPVVKQALMMIGNITLL